MRRGGWRWKEPGLTLPAEAFYRLCRLAVEVPLRVLYRLRTFHVDRVPSSGGLLVIANHTSHLDPPIVSMALRRRAMRSIARSGLFKHPFFAKLIGALGAIPIRENQGDMHAMRLAIDQIEQGRVVVVFPEGSRSPDGELTEFKRGCWLMISRAKCDVLPMAIVGAYETWPRDRAVPRLFPPRGGIGIEVGHVIPYADLQGLSADDGLRKLEKAVGELRGGLRERMHAAQGMRAWGA